jgi:hypothetical protein
MPNNKHVHKPTFAISAYRLSGHMTNILLAALREKQTTPSQTWKTFKWSYLLDENFYDFSLNLHFYCFVSKYFECDIASTLQKTIEYHVVYNMLEILLI